MSDNIDDWIADRETEAADELEAVVASLRVRALRRHLDSTVAKLKDLGCDIEIVDHDSVPF